MNKSDKRHRVLNLIIAVLATTSGLLVKLSEKRAVQGFTILIGMSYAGVSISGQLVTISGLLQR